MISELLLRIIILRETNFASNQLGGYLAVIRVYAK